MMMSFLWENNLKTQIVGILIRGQNRTAKQIFQEIKNKGISATTRGIYKALNELLSQKVIIKYFTNYEINPEWISQLGKDSNEALKKIFETKLIGASASELKHLCQCQKGNTEGFCSICQEMICNHCGFKELKHLNCEVNCINCQCGHQESICLKCGKTACPRCSKEVWIHEHQFCKKKENTAVIGILEVDHDCWFSNLSEKHKETISLNSFSDKKDEKTGTHSGILKIKIEDKNKAINHITKQEIIREAKLIHKVGNSYYIRTRALINKSVDEFTKANSSILLNPVIADDSKERNLILSPSQKEMIRLSKGLQEFGGKTRLVTTEEFNLNNINKISTIQITEFLAKVPKKELLDSLQKIHFLNV